MLIDRTAKTPRQRPGEVFTFYSYKGGTGRSMLLANVAWLLASTGSRVLLIDWDLEAPGLHRYLKPFLGADTELRGQVGVIEWLTDYWDAFVDHPDQQQEVEALVRSYADPRNYVLPLQTTGFLTGSIDLLCAGRQDEFYASLVAEFDYTRLYKKLRGAEFIDVAKKILTGDEGYDYILVDSRTGVSDTAGFCTVSLPDTLVVCFTYNNQSVEGASSVARDIRDKVAQQRSVAGDDGLSNVDKENFRPRPFRVFAVPSRVDDVEPDRLERRQRHAWDSFKDLLPPEIPLDQQERYWLSIQIRNSGLFAYEEVLAACVNRAKDRQSVLGAVVELTALLTRGQITSAPDLSGKQREFLRNRFAGLSEKTSMIETWTAWETFTQRCPEPQGRESVLSGCLPLLIQMFSAGEASTASGLMPFTRSVIMESELDPPEQHMAETLLMLGLVQFRLTDDRRRGLRIADESVLEQWNELRSRLLSNIDFLTYRSRVTEARQAWESAGRAITALRTTTSDVFEFEFPEDQKLWLGRENLRWISLAKEIVSHESLLKQYNADTVRVLDGTQDLYRARENDLKKAQASVFKWKLWLLISVALLTWSMVQLFIVSRPP